MSKYVINRIIYRKRDIDEKIATCLILAGCVILLFSGCGKSVKNEAAIRADLDEGNYLSSEGVNFKTSEFRIIKRQTDVDNKSDKIFASIKAISEDVSAQMTGEYTITYGLYNDGWLIDDVSTDSVTILPLQGKEFTNDELVEAFSVWEYDNIETVSVHEYEEDLENGMIYYYVYAEDVCAYATEYIYATITFYYSISGGWQPWNCWVDVGSSEYDWHIAGKYDRPSERVADYITINDDAPSGQTSIYIDDPESDYHDEIDGDHIWLHDLNAESLETIVADANPYKSVHKYIEDYGFPVHVQGDYAYYYDIFDYVLVARGSGSRNNYFIFIEKNDIACAWNNTETDEYNRRVLIDVSQMVPIE